MDLPERNPISSVRRKSTSAILTIEEAVLEIGKLLRGSRTRQKEPTSNQKSAIRAVWSAVDNTRMIIRAIEEGKIPWPSPNPDLVALWSEAAIEISSIDPVLAQRLRQKAEYWSDPEQWSEGRILQAKIGIDEVASDARALLQAAVPQPPSSPKSGDGKEIFISHASEDKVDIAQPLATELERIGHTVWLDKQELRLGDDLRACIDNGLSKCKHGVVILSERFFEKSWTKTELAGLFAIEAADATRRLLSIRHGMTQTQLVEKSPLLAGRLSLSTEIGISAVAVEISKAVTQAT